MFSRRVFPPPKTFATEPQPIEPPLTTFDPNPIETEEAERERLFEIPAGE